MKRTLLSLLAILPAFSFAQVQIFTEHFDIYNSGEYAGEVSPFVSTWDGVVGIASTTDTQILDSVSNTPPNCVGVYGPSGGGNTDMMVVFPSNYTSGNFHYAMKFMVGAGAGIGGYFNVQANATSPGTAWIAEVYFAADGTGYADAGGQTLSFTYTKGTWIDIDILANLDLDQGEIYIEGNSIGTFVWSLEATGNGTGANKAFGGLNLYSYAPNSEASEYYFDDLFLEDLSGVGIEEEVLNPVVSVYPNPSSGNFTLNYSEMSMENATVTLVDILGKTIYTRKMNISGKGSLPFNLDLRNGVYFVTIADNNTKMTKKIIVKK